MATIQPEVSAAVDAPEVPQVWDPQPVPYGKPSSTTDSEPSYWALRAIASVLRVLGALSCLMAIVVLVLSLLSTNEAAAPIPGGRFAPPQRSILVLLAVPAALTIGGVQLFAGAELIVLLVNVARGSWRQTQLLERLIAQRYAAM